MTNPTPAATPAADSLAFLEDLLTESVQIVADQKAAKALQSRIRSGRASKQEQARAVEVELKAQWRPVANCEMWDQTLCECGHQHATFTQYMLEYAPLHSGVSLSHRWVKIEPQATVDGLPTKAIFNTRDVFHCSECSGPPEGAEVIIWTNSQPSMGREFEAEGDTDAHEGTFELGAGADAGAEEGADGEEEEGETSLSTPPNLPVEDEDALL